jgi:hypothetical protein
MTRFQVGNHVRVLVSWPALSDQVGTVLEVVNELAPEGEALYLVKFSDRFMRYYSGKELGPVSSPPGSEEFRN